MKLRILTLLVCLAAACTAQDIFQFSGNGAQQRFELAAPDSLAAKSRSVQGKSAIVLYDLSELPARDRLDKMTPADRAQRLDRAARTLTAKVLVKNAGETAIDAIRMETSARSAEPSLLAGWTTVAYDSPAAALAALRWLAGRKDLEFMPVLARKQFRRQAPGIGGTLRRNVNDPLYSKQWHLKDASGDLGLAAAWDFVTGKGINIAVVDDGVEIAHADLRENAYSLDSGFHRNFNTGAPNDPTPAAASDNHGTACAGLLGARGFNGIGVVGVAPEARIMGLRLISEPASDEDEGNAFAWQPSGTVTHVSSNSWGPADDGAAGGRASALTRAGMEKAATANRNGLGTVVVISAGNGRRSKDNSSYDGYSSSRFAIAVGAVNRQHQPSSFSEEGINVAISAYGGEFQPPEVLWTTSVTGNEAAAIRRKDFPSTEAPVDYTDAFNGTSAAAPQVSGAAALLLERNPRLGYRDVTEILMRSARRAGLGGGDAFVQNGGGFSFSHSFGAGLLNVAGALTLADDWRNLGPLLATSVSQPGIEAEIPDNDGDGIDIPFRVSDSIRVEHVEFTVNVEHPNRGDLAFLLTAPSGMRSLVLPRPADDNSDFENYTFTSVRHWGEDSRRTWVLSVIDTSPEDEGEIFSASLRVYGTAR